MKAVNYQGAFKVKVEDVPRPSIEHPDDVIVKVTTAGKPRSQSREPSPGKLTPMVGEQPSADLTCTW